MGCSDWHTVFRCKDFLGSTCLVLLELEGIRLAHTADIIPGLHLGRAEVLRGLRNFLNMDRSEHHSTDRPKERGMEKGSGRHSTVRGRDRSVFNQTTIGTVSMRRLLRDGAEPVCAFPRVTKPSWAEIETEQLLLNSL